MIVCLRTHISDMRECVCMCLFVCLSVCMINLLQHLNAHVHALIQSKRNQA